MNPIFDAKMTNFFDGKKFVPYRVGFYIRNRLDLSHTIASYWDGQFWYDGFYCYPSHNAVGHLSHYQDCDFKGMKNEWQES